MSAPVYNEAFAGFPVPDEIFDAYLRVVSIAIQGLMNRTPKRPLTDKVLWESIEPVVWGYGQGPFFRLDLNGQNNPIFVWRPTINEADGYRWNKTVHENFDAIRSWPSQKEVEAAVSMFFTRPYPVQHVSDEAVARAREYVTRVMRRSERGR